MAKRRSTFRRATARAVPAFRRARRRAFGSKRSGASMMGIMLGGFAYGATREKISNMLAPITAKMPLGNIADEVVLGAGAYFLAKNTSNKLVKDYAIAALTVESARLGEAVINGELNLSGASKATSAQGSGIFG